MSQKVGIPQGPRRVKQYVRDAYGLEIEAPTYRRFFDLAVSARIPAEFVNNRWMFDESDLDEIVRAFRLVPENAVKRSMEQAAA